MDQGFEVLNSLMDQLELLDDHKRWGQNWGLKRSRLSQKHYTHDSLLSFITESILSTASLQIALPLAIHKSTDRASIDPYVSDYR